MVRAPNRIYSLLLPVLPLSRADSFFASVCGSVDPLRELSDRAFAKARDHLHAPALASLNDLVVQHADSAGLVARWCGMRLVAADASVLMPAVRPCLLKRSAASGLHPGGDRLTCWFGRDDLLLRRLIHTRRRGLQPSEQVRFNLRTDIELDVTLFQEPEPGEMDAQLQNSNAQRRSAQALRRA